MLHWTAHYHNGQSLRQFQDGKENAYADIEICQIGGFEIRDGERLVLFMHIPVDGRLIYRQRVEKSPGLPEVRVWIVGVQSTQRDVSSQYICAIFPDGHMEILDRFVEDTSWFYLPQLLPHEKWEV